MTIDPWNKKRSLYGSVPQSVKKPKTRWRPLYILWGAIKKTCTVIGAVVLISTIISIYSFSALIEEAEVSLPDQMVLYLEFDGELSEQPKQASLLDPFGANSVTIKSFVDALDRASKDPRVEGIYARLEKGGYQIAHIQEMREAIKRFRESGKFAYIYSSSYAETGGLGSYYLASAFDEIWMQPMGTLSVAGINAEMPFLRGVLDKIGIEPQFFQRKEYKSAYENLTHSNMTTANREQMEALIGDIAATIQKETSAERKISETLFKAYVDQALFTAPEAEKSGLIQHADYADKLVSKINKQVTGDPDLYALTYINIVDYIMDTEKTESNFTGSFIKTGSANPTGKAQVALIYAVGAIMDTKEPGQDGIAAADEIGSAIIDAGEDPEIDTIVLRIDSPGGSPVASESILHAIEMAKAKGKYIIVSMGPTAASGGYWIAAYADQIFVMPSTLTGSIGVLGGKVSAKELWEKIGVNWDNVKWGKNSALWSMNTPFSETEAERMNAMLDNIYINFLKRVAKGRNIKEDDVDKIARGRVWTGNQAIKIKLADQLGGLTAALDFAAVKAGGKDRNDIDIVLLPAPLSPIEEFMQLLEGQVMAGQVMASFGNMASAFMPMMKEFAVMNENGPKVYEPLRVK